MRNLGKLVAHIPARSGSKRVRNKNLRFLAGKPLIGYAIEVAKTAAIFEQVVVNSDSDEILKYADLNGASIYKRSAELADDNATGDEFTYEFIQKFRPDTLVMINPVCPLIEATDVLEALKAFKSSNCDTLISCCNSRMQTFCNSEPVNICVDGHLAPSQENSVVSILNWAVTIWSCEDFIRNYLKRGSAYLGKNRVLFPLDPIKGIKISEESDFLLAETIVCGRKSSDKFDDRIWSSF